MLATNGLLEFNCTLATQLAILTSLQTRTRAPEVSGGPGWDSYNLCERLGEVQLLLMFGLDRSRLMTSAAVEKTSLRAHRFGFSVISSLWSLEETQVREARWSAG